MRDITKVETRMFAVIFKAKIKQLDDNYFIAAKRMRELALNEYGCLDFTCVTQGQTELAISYWSSKEQIKNWKENTEHLEVQGKGKTFWYESYTVQVLEVLHQYEAEAH